MCTVCLETLQNRRNQALENIYQLRNKMWKTLTQEQGASGSQDRDMTGKQKNKRKNWKKIGARASIGFAVVCSLQMAFKLILDIEFFC